MAARGRDNLVVRADLEVSRVLIRDGRAVGVEAGGEAIPARTVVLCAGAPHSPALLLRSGIGPADVLRAGGVDVLADLPGVGTRLYDQPGAVLPGLPLPGVLPAEPPRTPVVARLRGVPGAAPRALYLNVFLGSPPDGGEPIVALMVGDMEPHGRGAVTLGTAGTTRVDLGFLADPADRAALRAGVRHAWALARHPAFASCLAGWAMVDDATVDDDGALDALLSAMVFSRLTLAGGACMGPDGDPAAVVDAHCRVRGVEGLAVADLSIVPVPMRATSAFEAMMIGEHASQWI